MTTTQAAYIIQCLKEKGVMFAAGLTDEEVRLVEETFNFRFPPDLKCLLQVALPVSKSFINWRQSIIPGEVQDNTRVSLAWPLEGILFDLQWNRLWLEEWGTRPEALEDAALIVKKHYATYPKLIPVYSHRYIPDTPHLEGNPVFSVYQTDIIYYGYELATYFANEFRFVLPADFDQPTAPLREISFWSGMAG